MERYISFSKEHIISILLVFILGLLLGLGASQIDTMRYQYIPIKDGLVYKIDRINGKIFIITPSSAEIIKKVF